MIYFDKDEVDVFRKAVAKRVRGKQMGRVAR